MGIEIAFSEYNGGRSLRMEECFNEYFEAREETEAKVDVVIKIDENNNELSNKCNALEEYLNHYNKKYEKCFKGDIGYMYLQIRNSISQALTKCDRHDESHTSRMREGKKLTPDSEQYKGPPEVDDPETKTSELEKGSKAAQEGKDEFCKTECSGKQGMPGIKEAHGDKPEQGKDKVTFRSSQEGASPNTFLPTNRENTQDVTYSPIVNKEEDRSLKDLPSLEAPGTGEKDTHPDKSPKDDLHATSDPKRTSDVTGLGNDNLLCTHTSNNSTITPEALIPRNSHCVIRIESQIDKFHNTFPSLTASVTNISLSQNSAKASRLVLSPDTEEGVTSGPHSPDLVVQPTTSLSPGAVIEHADLSSQFPKLASPGLSTSAPEVAAQDSSSRGKEPGHPNSILPVGEVTHFGSPSHTEMPPFYGEPSSEITSSQDSESIHSTHFLRGEQRLSDSHITSNEQLSLGLHSSSISETISTLQSPYSMQRLNNRLSSSGQQEIPDRMLPSAEGTVPREQETEFNQETKSSVELGKTRKEYNEEHISDIFTITNHTSENQSALHNKVLSQNSAGSSGNGIVTYDTNPVTPETEPEGFPLRMYVIIILIILGVLLLLIILFKFTSLGGLFSKKKKNKRQEMQEELEKIMYSPPNVEKNSIFFSYGSIEH
ncbi:PIR Superfamily Protein [Plasmodium ovale curtisi]|uniref:PIR Superfamily Protein n=1 Tax=Plasmodium ovale curtisi TaxID=864141 RepID=A0A1A8XAX6_PLAOA|nr:PIR Superfamily Protein [Plasmodium ovale curtisi]